MEQGVYYHMASDRFDAVVRLVQASEPMIAEADLREFILGDWAEGAEHQAWLDTADLADIAGWARRGPDTDIPHPPY